MATKIIQVLDSLNKNAVLYTPQELTEEEKSQARENIGVPVEHNHNGSYYIKDEIDSKVSTLESADQTISDNLNTLSESVDALRDNSQLKSNLITSIESISTDVQYPSAKAVYDQLATKQNQLTFDATPTADSINPVTSGGVKSAITEVINVAEGKCKAYVMDDRNTLIDWLTNYADISSLKTGDVFLIRAINVPDYWWEPVAEAVTLSQYTDNDIIIDGKGAARVLETTKVDLADYALASDIPAKLSDLSDDSTHRLVTDAEKTAWSAKSNFSGSYNDLTNKPTIPSAYTHPSTHPASIITGLAAVATSGSYNDLSNKPTIPSSLPANGGNADTVDSYHIAVASSAPTTNNTKIITFVV